MIIGHNKQQKYFQNIISNGMLSHAYLFTGPEMTGKRTFAEDLVKMINKSEVGSDMHYRILAPDIDKGESKLYIEDIRKLKSFFSIKSYGKYKKIAIINDAHLLTVEASNALLKLLEEPPSSSVIILVTHLPGMLLSTILSRCEEVRFMPAKEMETQEYLDGVKRFKKEDRDFVSILGNNRIGLTRFLLEGNNLKEAREAIEDLRHLLKSGIYERMEYAKKMKKDEYVPTVDYWLNWVSAHIDKAPKNRMIVKNLLTVSNIISQPQYNHRLVMENFLINL